MGAAGHGRGEQGGVPRRAVDDHVGQRVLGQESVGGGGAVGCAGWQAGLAA